VNGDSAASPEATAPREEAAPAATPARARIESILGALVAAAIALAVPVTFALPRFAKIERASLWGIVLMISMAGWGGVIERLAFPKLRADLGLRMAWGAAALVGAGGLLCLVTLATTPVAVTLVLGGVASSLVVVVRARRAVGARLLAWLRLWPWGLFVVFLGLCVLAIVQYLGGASGQHLNANDDQAAYIIFARKILATGTLVDPFSMRRITAYGGHSFLQALTIIGTSTPLQISLLDIGVCLFVVIALVMGAVGSKTSRVLRALVVLPVLFLLTLPDIRLNTASEMSGVLFFLALYRTAAWSGFKERPTSGALVLGLIAAGACSLRQSYLVPVAVFMVAFYMPEAVAALRALPGERKRHLVTVGRAAGYLALFLLPWALLSFRSNRTFLFPLLSGTYRPEYAGFTTHQAPLDRLKFLWLNMCHCHPITTLPFFLLAGVLIPARRNNGALRALLFAAFIGFFAVVLSLPLSDRWNIARYYYGFSVALVVAIMLEAFTAPWRTRAGRVRAAAVVPAVIALAALLNQVQEGHSVLHPMYERTLSAIVSASGHPSPLDERGDAYQKMQAAIPAGEPWLVMLDEPFWLDYRRNPINLVDLPGASSPAPGMPLDNDEALAGYLKAQGYRYLAFVRSTASKSLYRREHWNKQLTNPSQELEIWRLSAPFYLKTFDRFDGLAKSRLKVYDDGTMVALDLETKAQVEKPAPEAN
jgi:hypothetical protein